MVSKRLTAVSYYFAERRRRTTLITQSFLCWCLSAALLHPVVGGSDSTGRLSQTCDLHFFLTSLSIHPVKCISCPFSGWFPSLGAP